MLKLSDDKYDCFDDINCTDAALQKCRYFMLGRVCDICCMCSNDNTCRELLKKRRITSKQAEIQGALEALSGCHYDKPIWLF